MRVPVRFYANGTLYPLLTGELKLYSENPSGRGGFLPGLKQMANVAALPGIVGASVGLPDCHSGYGFAIGNVAAFDGADPSAVVSPGGVGFDINCGKSVQVGLVLCFALPLIGNLNRRPVVADKLERV